MTKVDKVVTNTDEFEDLDLDLDTPSTSTAEVTETETVADAGKESDSLDGLDLDKPPTPPAEPVKDKLAPAVSNPLDSEIDLDLDIPTTSHPPKTEKPKEEPPKAEKPKVSKKKVETPKEETPKVEKPKSVEKTSEVKTSEMKTSMLLDPMFDISKVLTTKYQTRQIEHSSDEIESFAKILKAVGQVEPVHVHKEGDEFFLMAGFKRHAALTKNGSKTIKAIIHENLPETEIEKISVGTNNEHKPLSDWDKIGSVGLFSQGHPSLKADKDLPAIFGFGKSTIYKYIELFAFFSKLPEFVSLFKTYDMPYHTIETIYSTISAQKDREVTDENIIEFVVGKIEDGIANNKKAFLAEFTAFFSDAAMEAKMKKEAAAKGEAGTEGSGGVASGDDLGDLNLDGTDTDPTPKANKDPDGKGIENPNADHEVNKNMTMVVDLLTNVEKLVSGTIAIENFKSYLDIKILNRVSAKTSKLAKIITKMI